MCVYKPMFGLFPNSHCWTCLLKPPSLSHSLTFTTSHCIYPRCCKWGTALLQVGRGETGGRRKKRTAAALTAVSMVRLLTRQSATPPFSIPHAPNPLFPLQRGFDMLKYRERQRKWSDTGGLFRCGIRHVFELTLFSSECVAALILDVSLRKLWTHRVNDFSRVWDSPLLNCLPSCLSSL